MSANIKSVIVEDNAENAGLLKYHLSKFFPNIKLNGVAGTVNEAISLINKASPQLLFLDIQLERGTAFEVLERIDFNKMKIIFITSLDNHAIKAFKYHAVDYLLKPYKTAELVVAVNKALRDIDRESYVTAQQITALTANFSQSEKVPFDFIAVPSMDRIEFLSLHNIVHLESDGRYTVIHLEENKLVISTKNLGEYEKQLNPKRFFRIHKSYIINISKLKSINKMDGNYCVMQNAISLPIAKRRSELLKRMIGYKDK